MKRKRRLRMIVTIEVILTVGCFASLFLLLSHGGSGQMIIALKWIGCFGIFCTMFTALVAAIWPDEQNPEKNIAHAFFRTKR